MGDYIILAIIIAILISAIAYVVKQKKKGVKCIGCPHSKNCSSCSCSANKDNNKIS